MQQALTPNQQLAGYEILALVGKGGMGEVYRARQLSMDRIVALKVLHLHHAKQDPFTKSFIEEARAAGRLSHPNIIAVHDVGSSTLPGSGEQVHYFSMEYVEGESLKDVITREGRCPDDLTAVVMAGMAEAMTYAEKMGIVHRDIKPDNIMITKDRLVKLADLGLAVQVSSDQISADQAGDTPPAERSKVMGTPMYMSPEQARALKLDHRSDQYSLGATLFHLLTGLPPYRAGDARAIMRSHVFDPIPDPRELRPDVPETWRQLCLRLMAKQPEERFATALELRAAVHAANHGLTLGSLLRKSPRLAPRRIETGSRMGQALMVAGAVVVLAVVTGMVLLHRGPGAGAGGASAGESGTGTGAVDAHGVQDLTPLHAVLAGLPADNQAALEAMKGLSGRPEWSSPPARALLQDAINRRQSDLEAARQTALATQLQAITQALAAGNIQAAQSQYAAFLHDHAESAKSEAVTSVGDQIGVALAGLATGARSKIAGAGSGAEIDAVLADTQSVPFTADQRTSFAQAAAARRGELARAAEERSNQALSLAWTQLASELETPRRNLTYNGMDEIVHRRAGTFPPAFQDTLKALEGLQSAASAGELAVHQYADRVHPALDAVVDGVAEHLVIEHWSAAEILWQEAEPPHPGPAAAPAAPVKPELHRTPRARFRLRGAAALLDKAIAEDPRAAAASAQGQVKAATLWMWRDPGMMASAQALGEDQLGRGIASLIRGLDGGQGLNAEVERNDSEIRVTYDFAGREPATLHDFSGQDLVFGEHGLLWASKSLVPLPVDGVGEEARLPRLAWRGQLLPPLQLHATLWLHPGMAMAMIGFEVGGGRRLRVGISHDRFSPLHHSDRMGLVITQEDGIHFAGSVLVQEYTLWDPAQPLNLTMTMAANGQISADINKVSLGGQIAGALPSAGPVSVILQTYQNDGETDLELSALEITGTLPAP